MLPPQSSSVHSLVAEKFADDFKDLNDKQMQLNNQQQQLQAKILEQTKQLKDPQQKLLGSAETSTEQSSSEKGENDSSNKQSKKHWWNKILN